MWLLHTRYQLDLHHRQGSADGTFSVLTTNGITKIHKRGLSMQFMRKSTACYPHRQVCEWMHQDPHPAQPHPTHPMTKLSQTLQGAGLVPRCRRYSFTAPVFQVSQLHSLKLHSCSLKHPSCRTSQPKCNKHNVFYLTAEFEASQLQHLKLHSCSLKCPSCKIWNFTTQVHQA